MRASSFWSIRYPRVALTPMTNASLFDPIQFGPTTCANRLVMAPLTRLRAGEDGVPNALMQQYYVQRASVGLIVTEGTWPVLEGRTWHGQPGIETQEQQDEWSKIADAVHAEGGKIAMQIMHGGRVSHPELSRSGRTVAPSALASPNPIRVFAGKVPAPVPEALTIAEIREITDGFVAAARRAIDAGMDAVQIHGANGYLLHQFLSPVSNIRDDEYGGSAVNHARMVIEVVRAVAAEIGAERTGLRLSPQHNVQGVLEPDDAFTREVYVAVAEGLADLPLHHVDLLSEEPSGALVQELRQLFDAPCVVNTGFSTPTTRNEALSVVADGVADAVSVGRAVIANPDVVRRWRDELPENELVSETIYAKGALGYTDYPFFEG